ncbi:T-cell surface glycoprotein CD1b-3-like isoform X4 [Buteo buteo]|uniref:T-cell surface glycoprotein CD1b-3-like isoform X4 n=1 Tax=Buteo buteo TaxID=30397 RepID=UPI003EB7DA1C
MQHPRLLLFLLLLLPGTWADPEDPFVFQCATGCDLYPNGSYTKFYHLAYNAHNFLSFDVDNSHWERREESALAAQVERQFNNFTGFSVTLQHLLNVTCVDHMKKFIEYGKASLERQEPPVATVFSRTPKPDQLLLVCRVTGFYPRPISVAWLQDGQEMPPGPALNTSAILPNADLTYQLRSILAVAPHDGHSYACRVRHRSLGTRSLLIPWGRCYPWGWGAGCGQRPLAPCRCPEDGGPGSNGSPGHGLLCARNPCLFSRQLQGSSRWRHHHRSAADRGCSPCWCHLVLQTQVRSPPHPAAPAYGRWELPGQDCLPLSSLTHLLFSCRS